MKRSVGKPLKFESPEDLLQRAFDDNLITVGVHYE